MLRKYSLIAKKNTRKAVNYRRAKIRFFAPQGRLDAPIHVKLGTTDEHVGSLGCAKFHLNRRRGMGMRPQNIQNFHFSVKTRPAGAIPLTVFENFQGFLIRLTILQISYDLHHRLRSYCWETALHSIRPNFFVYPVWKTIRWIKKMDATFLMASTSSISVQSLGRIAQCAPAVGAKLWCFLFFFSL